MKNFHENIFTQFILKLTFLNIKANHKLFSRNSNKLQEKEDENNILYIRNIFLLDFLVQCTEHELPNPKIGEYIRIQIGEYIQFTLHRYV